MIRRFIADDRGQDMVEYALLGALIGVTGILAWANLGTAINSSYGLWDAGAQALSSCTPNPGGGGC